MIFVDEARIFIKSGDGGQGCESFYKDKYMRYRRPDGGDGGRGGDVIFKADRSVQTLLDF
ncbi:GTP-binding protein Obg, partial [hydrothermal vent metagenome]